VLEEICRYVLTQSFENYSLHHNLTEHLLSEICIGTIVDVKSSITWLESTFLCIRVNKNPLYYQTVCSNGLTSKHSTHQIMHGKLPWTVIVDVLTFCFE
jgi:hypothetical protein